MGRIYMTIDNKTWQAANRINKSALEALIAGVARLVEGQMRFADEFGMHVAKVFPLGHEQLAGKNLENLLREFLYSKKGDVKLQDLVHALIDHQLALLMAVDGVVLHTVKELEPKNNNKKSLLNLLAYKQNQQQQYNFLELKQSQQLRYHKLISPGLVDNYMHAREQINSKEVNT